METASAAASPGGDSLQSLLPSGPDAPTPGTQAGAVGGQGPVVPGTPQPCSHSGPAERGWAGPASSRTSADGVACVPQALGHTRTHTPQAGEEDARGGGAVRVRKDSSAHALGRESQALLTLSGAPAARLSPPRPTRFALPCLASSATVPWATKSHPPWVGKDLEIPLSWNFRSGTGSETNWTRSCFHVHSWYFINKNQNQKVLKFECDLLPGEATRRQQNSRAGGWGRGSERVPRRAGRN